MGSWRPRSAKPGDSRSAGVKEQPYRLHVDDGVHVVAGAAIVNERGGTAGPRTGMSQARARIPRPVVGIPRPDRRTGPMLLDRAGFVLFVVDIQARLAPAVADAEAVLARTAHPARGRRPAGRAGPGQRAVPAGPGPHRRAAGRCPRVRPCSPRPPSRPRRDPAIARAPARRSAGGRSCSAGMEAHVCVLQTALGLRAAGWRSRVVADAVGSRPPSASASAWSACGPTGSRCRQRDGGVRVAGRLAGSPTELSGSIRAGSISQLTASRRAGRAARSARPGD